MASIPKGTTLVGPFKPEQRPTRSGLYLRVSRDTGEKVFAYYDAGTGNWGLYSDTKERAMKRRHKRSKKALPWYGTTAPKSASKSAR
jgi:hypothetical protein